MSFGEVLWDLLPQGNFLGGAPLNVVLDTQQLGVKSTLISAIGKDEWGQKAIEQLQSRAFDTDFIETNEFETGTVSVELDEKGSPSYIIHEPVAWDYIPSSKKAMEALKLAKFLVMGTLACRNAISRSTLYHYLAHFKGKVVFDLNFRAPFFQKQLVQRLLEPVHVLKLNDEELVYLKKWFHLKHETVDQLTELKERFNLEEVILTKGAEGAFLMDLSYKLYQVDPISIQIKDTIGAGDAFLAGYLYARVQEMDSLQTLRFANACGAYVASQKGATPELSLVAIDAQLKHDNKTTMD